VQILLHFDPEAHLLEEKNLQDESDGKQNDVDGQQNNIDQ